MNFNVEITSIKCFIGCMRISSYFNVHLIDQRPMVGKCFPGALVIECFLARNKLYMTYICIIYDMYI